MTLNLYNLKRDYKLIRKKDFKVAQKILALVELIKIDCYYSRRTFIDSKKLRLLALCEGTGISLRTLYRWKAAYIASGVSGLAVKKQRGRSATPIPERAVALITEMRSQFRWGSEVIQAHLRIDYGICLTRYKIEQFLTRSGLRDKYPCTTKKARSKKVKRHTKIVVIDDPGEHTQLDAKHLPRALRGSKCFVINFIDHASNWSFKYAYSKLNQYATEDFLKRLIKVCPFQIQSIQTDHGMEFTYKHYWKMRKLNKEHPLDIFCKENGIQHRLIVPGEKEVQGLVERSNRQDDQEFYIRMGPVDLLKFNTELSNYCSFRNERRRFKKNNWQTPNEYLKNCLINNATAETVEKFNILPFYSNSKKDNNIKELTEDDDILVTKKAA